MSSYYRLEGSKDVLSSDLDLFLTPPTDSGVEQVEWVDYRPVSTVGLNGVVEFRIPGSGMHYIDMKRTLLYWKSNPLPETGSDFDPSIALSDKLLPVNNTLHSVFNQVDVTLNQKLVSSHTQHYGYKAMIESCLNYGRAAQESQMKAAGFYKRTSNSLDPWITETDFVEETVPVGEESATFRYLRPNPNYDENLRYRAADYFAFQDYTGPLFADLFQQDRLLLNGVEVGVKLYRSPPAFYMNSGKVEQTAKNYQLGLDNIVLRVCKVKLSPQLLLSHEKMLETTPAKYPYLRSELKTITIPSSSSTFRVENLFQNKVPSRVVITSVKDFSVAGNLYKDPFVFDTDRITSTIKVDGISVPFQAGVRARNRVSSSFGGGQTAESYYSMFQSLGREGSDFGTLLDRNALDTFVCFDLSGMGAPSLDTLPLFRRGEVSIDFEFETSADRTMLVLAYFPDMYQVDKSRNVLM